MVTVKSERSTHVSSVVLLMVVMAMGWGRAGTSAAMNCRVELRPQQAAPGEVVTLIATVEGEFGWSADFKLPDLVGVNAAEGGSNQSVSMVNGVTRASVSRTWFLTVTGNRNVEVGPIDIRAGKKSCSTEPVTLTVTPTGAGGALHPSVTGNRQARPRQGRTDPAMPRAGRTGEDIFVTLAADRSEAWVGQQIILTFGYWYRVRPWNNPTFTPPRTEGFWREDLGTERNFNRIVAGRTYSVTEVRYALFPTHSGDLVVEPAELHFPADVFGSLFGSSRRKGPRTLRTDSLHIRVKELPPPRPADFSGLVASKLQINASVAPDTVGTGDPLTLEANLVADAFLKGFAGLTVTPPPGVQMHDADAGFQAQEVRGRLEGKVTLEKILVPRTPGPLVVPPLELVWFDTQAGQYRTARAELEPVAVTGADLGLPESDSGFLREGLQRRTRDLAFIHPVPRKLRRTTGGVVGSAVWWILLLLPALLLIVGRQILERLAAAGRDVAGRRRRRALQNAKTLMKEAGTLEGVEACTLVARAIRGFAEDMTASVPGTGDAGHIRLLATDPRSEEAARDLTAILDHCDHVRFGGVEPEPVDTLIRRALSSLTDLAGRHGPGRSGPSRRVTGAILALVLLGAMGSSNRSAVAADQAEQWVAEGNQAYTEGDLETAVARYRKALESGIDDPVLHFNLGNAEARRGHLGAAVASYLRAQRLDPGDGDIRKNLAFVRGFIRDLELADSEQPLFLSQLARLSDTLNLVQWGWMLILTVWVLGAFLAWVLWTGAWGTRSRRMTVFLSILVCLTAGMTGWRWYLDRGRDLAVISAEEVAVRSGPNSDFPTLFAVHDGLTVNIEGRAGDWFRIGLGGEWTGWVPVGDIERVNLDLPAVQEAGQSSPGR